MSDEPNSNTPPPAAPAAIVELQQQQPAPEQAPIVDERDAKIQALESQLAEAKREAENQRMKAALASVNKKVAPLHTGADYARRQNAIRIAGGPAKWFGLTATERVQILNDGACPAVGDEQLRNFFGRNSNAVEANRLAKEDPTRYRAYRILAKERGLL